MKPPPKLPDNEPPDLQDVHPNLTRDEIGSALFDQDPGKAPGVSQNSFLVVRRAWGVDEGLIIALARRCVDLGHHPRDLKKSIAIALRKPKKPDYSDPKAYRLIQLLECLGKVIERVVAVRLAHMVGTHHLVSENQFGSRPNSSTIDAVASYVEDVEAARKHGLVTSVLTFDISGFFDNVNHNRLL